MVSEATVPSAPPQGSRAERQDLPAWVFWALVGVVFALAVGMRLWRIEDPPLWYDEVASWITASKSVPELIRSCQANVHPPLYFLLLKGWMAAFGDGPASLRLFSALTTLLVMAAGMLLVRAVASDDVPRWRMLYVTILLGTAPLLVLYGREVRMYALGAFWAVASCWAVLRAQTTERTGWLVTAGFLAALGCYTHNYLLIHTFFLALYVAFVGIRRRYWDWVWAALIPGLLYLPWVPELLGQMARVKQDYWINPPSLFESGMLLVKMWSGLRGPLASIEYCLAGYGVTVVAAFLVLLEPFRGRWLLVLCSLGVGVGAAVWSIVWKPILVWRYLTPAFAVLCCAMALAAPLRDWLGRVVASMFVVILVFLHVEFWPRYLPPADAQDLRDAVAWLRERRKPDEPLVMNSPFLYLPWRYYDRGNNMYLAAYPTWEDVPHYLGKALLKPSDIWDGTILKRCKAVWSAGMGAAAPGGPVGMRTDKDNAYTGPTRVFMAPDPIRVQRYIVVSGNQAGATGASSKPPPNAPDG